MRVALLTVSDSVSQGKRKDLSGPAVAQRCNDLGWQVLGTHITPDEQGVVQARLIEMADSGMVDLILSVGGTGLGPRDVTPEATFSVCSRVVPGLAERMREVGSKSNPRALLSRGLAGVRGRTLIVNLPGSPRGAVESLDAVADLLPHAIEVLRGARHD
jgi:molybdenum cofactor synthesis domain-containing protein